MGISKIIQVGTTLAFLAAASGNLPWVIKRVRIAQLHLVKDSQASKWPKAWTPSEENIKCGRQKALGN